LAQFFSFKNACNSDGHRVIEVSLLALVTLGKMTQMKIYYLCCIPQGGQRQVKGCNCCVIPQTVLPQTLPWETRLRPHLLHWQSVTIYIYELHLPWLLQWHKKKYYHLFIKFYAQGAKVSTAALPGSSKQECPKLGYC